MPGVWGVATAPVKPAEQQERDKCGWEGHSEALLKFQFFCWPQTLSASRVGSGTAIFNIPRVGFPPKTREIKRDVTWSYVKRQTAKMKLLPSVFSSLNSRVKIFVFVANRNKHTTIMGYHLDRDRDNTPRWEFLGYTLKEAHARLEYVKRFYP